MVSIAGSSLCTNHVSMADVFDTVPIWQETVPRLLEATTESAATILLYSFVWVAHIVLGFDAVTSWHSLARSTIQATSIAS